jgi:hypothetical protein
MQFVRGGGKLGASSEGFGPLPLNRRRRLSVLRRPAHRYLGSIAASNALSFGVAFVPLRRRSAQARSAREELPSAPVSCTAHLRHRAQ